MNAWLSPAIRPIDGPVDSIALICRCVPACLLSSDPLMHRSTAHTHTHHQNPKQGGMTSHAAVVARGMGKPCVSGCQSIEVDAHKARTHHVCVDKL